MSKEQEEEVLLLPVAVETNHFWHEPRANLIPYRSKFRAVDENTILKGRYLFRTPFSIRVPALPLFPLRHGPIELSLIAVTGVRYSPSRCG